MATDMSLRRLLGEIRYLLRVQKPVTRLLGPKYRRSRNRIEIDITYQCNLMCRNYNRSSRQAPSADRVSLNQIRSFAQESASRAIQWETIRVLGGEPTLHPDLFSILDILLDYKAQYCPGTRIQLVTNGHGSKVKRAIEQVPAGIEIENTAKEDISPEFVPFNLAPIDSMLYRHADFSNGCGIISVCGIGLPPYGYYVCAIAGGIDRVFGFGKGHPALPAPEDSMADQLNTFCKLCGHFRYPKKSRDEVISPSWRRAYEQYRTATARLSPRFTGGEEHAHEEP